ncbi:MULTISPECIES: serine protease [unclassified Thiocapsa]|uniref:serine protease n=1 Tax=unclassified Thiocapsa TaxID=2641286 RepID=UPI0035B479A5
MAESLWTHSIDGDAIFLQIEAPRARDAGIRSIRFRIAEALLIDTQALAFCPINASCVQDGSCYDTSDWAMIDVARKAIANMLFIQGGSGYICTGGLLNDTDTSNQIPYFLTANHCISTQAVASTVETRFNYQTAACGGACVWPNTPTTLGATLLHTSTTDDHTLLRLNQDPLAGAAFLGWSTSPVANTSESALYRLSHPKGSPQAYSTHAVSTTAGTCRGLPRGAFIYSRDQVGAAEGGSSGSPVMNQQGQVVGQLFGKCGTNLGDVCDSASNATVDGAFANYFSQVAEWLDPGSDPDPCPSEVLVADHSGASTWLGLLRGVRDHVLPTLSDGAWMRERYYRHAAEVTRILAGDRRLRADALALLQDLRPALETAVVGGDLVLNRREQGAMIGFATALQDSASPDLADDLERFVATTRR